MSGARKLDQAFHRIALTSLYPATHGAKTDGAMVPKGATLLSESLKEAGFATGSFIANGYVSDKFGFNQGWDYYTNYIREKKSTDAENVFKEAGDWVEQHKDERFFAYVHTIDPHVPYDPPAEFLSMYTKGAEYAGQVSPRKTPDQLARPRRTRPRSRSTRPTSSTSRTSTTAKSAITTTTWVYSSSA